MEKGGSLEAKCDRFLVNSEKCPVLQKVINIINLQQKAKYCFS